jgi:membrane protein
MSDARKYPLKAFLGPIHFFRRAAARLNSIGWFRAAGSLSFVTLLGLVPLATVAFAFVARFPIFQDFLKVLETFLLRHMLPASASAIVHEYVVVLAEDAANAIGLSIIFVAITATLVVDTIESEINEIWGIRKKRPVARRILVYVAGITAGPVSVGAAISLIRWMLTEAVASGPLDLALTDAVGRSIPGVLLVTGLTLLYRVAPACQVRWRYAIASGVLAALALDVTKRIFTWYLTHFPSYELLYGALAAFPAFLFWIFLCWLIVLAGAAITATLAEAGGRASKAL